jgi:chromosome segregation ATPase
MATSNQLLTAFTDIKDEIEDLKDAIIDSNTHLENITKMLTLLNMSSARNARANDLNWKLTATTDQMNVLKNNQRNLQEEDANIQPLS